MVCLWFSQIPAVQGSSPFLYSNPASLTVSGPTPNTFLLPSLLWSWGTYHTELFHFPRGPSYLAEECSLGLPGQNCIGEKESSVLEPALCLRIVFLHSPLPGHSLRGDLPSKHWLCPACSSHSGQLKWPSFLDSDLPSAEQPGSAVPFSPFPFQRALHHLARSKGLHLHFHQVILNYQSKMLNILTCH